MRNGITDNIITIVVNIIRVGKRRRIDTNTQSRLLYNNNDDNTSPVVTRNIERPS